MGFEAHKKDFDRDGFVIVRNFLGKQEFQELKDNLDRYVREVVPGLPDSAAYYHDRIRPETLKQMQQMGHHDPYFEIYRDHPLWRGLAEALLGEPVQVDQSEWFNKPPGIDHTTPPHQDNYYFCLRPPNVLTIWLALDGVDEENGCLRYVAGSHLRGVRPHSSSRILGFSQGITDYGDEDRAREVKILLDPGDAVVHHGNTIHRAEPNRTTDRHRRAFALVMRGKSCRRDEEAFQRYQAAVKMQHQEMGLKTA
jgi:phytanoyl-CoA hydroxylase